MKAARHAALGVACAVLIACIFAFGITQGSAQNTSCTMTFPINVYCSVTPVTVGIGALRVTNSSNTVTVTGVVSLSGVEYSYVCSKAGAS